MPAFAHCDLALGTGLNDGTTWANAYQGGVGFNTGFDAASAGEILYVKNTATGAATVELQGIGKTNPVEIISVKSATTNEGVNIVQSDLIPGIRTGDNTPAYAQTGANAPPTLECTADANADFKTRESVSIYGMIFKASDNVLLAFAGGSATESYCWVEECKFIVVDATDQIAIGSTDTGARYFRGINCSFDAGAGNLRLTGPIVGETFNCIWACTDAGSITASEFTGSFIYHEDDFSACDDQLFQLGNWRGPSVELWNCKTPVNHILISGTPQDNFSIANYGSDDNTGLGAGDSEQALEIETFQGTVDIETTIVRTGGATDLADGLFAYAVIANRVTDNVVGVLVPLLDIWVEGDGTAKTYTAFIANSMVSTDLQDDEIYLRLELPSAAGISKYDYLPDEGAPRTGTLNYDAQSANFTVGAILTGGTSGAHGIIIADVDAGSTGTLTLEGIDGTFQNDETITDDNGSPGSATSDGTLTTTFHSGRMQLLGTAVDLPDDTGSTWGGSLDYDAQTANFTVGATLTGGSSGATAVILADTDAGDTGTLILGGITGAFSDGETITDDNGSPGSATSDGLATTGSNHQKLTQSIAPNYEGVIHGTLIYSRTAAATLYSDPLPVIT